MNRVLGTVIALLAWLVLPTAQAATPGQPHDLAQSPQSAPDPTDVESTDIDAAVRMVITETAVFVDECGLQFPEHKAMLDSAFANWAVLKLPIPDLAIALDPSSPDRVEFARAIGPYLRRIPPIEQEIECSVRYQMLISEEPQLGGDSARLPPDVLERYAR